MNISAFAPPAAIDFPIKELTKVDGKPTYLSVQKLKSELITNAVSVQTIQVRHWEQGFGDSRWSGLQDQ